MPEDTTGNVGGNGLSKNAQGVLGGLGVGLLSGVNNAISPNPGGTTTQSGSSTSTPTYSSAVLPLYNQLLQSHLNGITGNQNYFRNYQSQGQQQINQNSQQGSDSINRILAQRGLSTSPYAGTAQVQQELARQGQQTQFNNSIPLLQHQDLMNQLSQAGQFFSSLPVGQSSTSNSTSTTVAPKQGFLQGLLGGVAQALPSALALF